MPTPDEILQTLEHVSTEFGVTVADLTNRDRRERALNQARSAAVLMLYRRYPELSFLSIGVTLGRTRETVRELLARAEDTLLIDPTFAAHVQALLEIRPTAGQHPDNAVRS